MITFKNGSNYEEIAVYGAKETFQDAQRNTLDIIISAENITLEQAKSLWQDENATSEITIDYSETIDGEKIEKTGVHINYTLPMSLALDMLNGQHVVHVKLAQKSAIELMQEKQAQDMDDVNAALCELAEIIAGGENDG